MPSQPMLLVYAGAALASREVRPVMVTGTASLYERLQRADPTVWQAVLAVVEARVRDTSPD